MTILDELQHFVDASICDCEAAFKPYWPEMLDFSLEENKQLELDEIHAYFATFEGTKQ